jgi:hypothetical protein
MRIAVDLHAVFRNDRHIDTALLRAIFTTTRTQATALEIVYGNGSGQLRKRVKPFFETKTIRKLHNHVERCSVNTGRVMGHFVPRSVRRAAW